MAICFEDFDDALRAYLERGGYMLHEGLHPHEDHSPGVWWVGDHADIADMIFVPDRTPDDTTRDALEAGDMSAKDIERLLNP